MKISIASLVVSIIALIAPLLSLSLMLKERWKERRRYIQITYENVRSNLACIVLRNIGNIPLEMHGLTLNDSFTKQLPQRAQNNLKKIQLSSCMIPAGQKFIISFEVTVATIIAEYNEKTVKIEYLCSHHEAHWPFNIKLRRKTKIDFSSYGPFLTYISGVDELKNSVDSIGKSIKEINGFLLSAEKDKEKEKENKASDASLQ